MKCVILLGWLSVLTYASSALAQAAEVRAAAPVGETSRFSAGAGIGYASDGLGGGGLGGLSGAAGSLGYVRGNSPFGTALLELALTRNLRLGVGASGSYVKASHEDERTTSSVQYPEQAGFVSGTLSLRWILNVDDVVQVSPMLTAGGSWNTVKGLQSSYVPATDTEPSTYLKADAEGYGIDGRLALVLEYRLMPQLFLRFESYFARAGYNKSDAVTKDRGARQHERMSQTSLNFGWLPALQLRLTF